MMEFHREPPPEAVYFWASLRDMPDNEEHQMEDRHQDDQGQNLPQAPSISHPHMDWRSLTAALLAAILVATTAYLVPRYHRAANPLEGEVAKLTTEVNELRQEQEMPSLVLNRYRGSICYIFGVYRVGFPNNPLSSLRARVAGTGFVVADGLVATNRHVAEPWYGDPEAEALIQRGAVGKLEKLLAYFPDMPTPIDIDPVVDRKSVV